MFDNPATLLLAFLLYSGVRDVRWLFYPPQSAPIDSNDRFVRGVLCLIAAYIVFGAAFTG